MHLDPLIRDLAVVLASAGLVAFVFQRLQQPVVLGYLLAGVIVGPFTPPFSLVTDIPGIKVWAELGVIFLMFSIGLEFNFHKLRRVGRTAGIAAFLKVSLLWALGFGAGKLFAWNNTDCLFLGAILAISSTTIVIKAFEELGLKDKPFAETAVGVLVAEDLLGILMLAALPVLGSGDKFSGLSLSWEALKLFLVVALLLLVGYKVLPPIIRSMGRVSSDETMLVTTLGLCLTLVVVASWFRYSAALGAFVMGSILAESVEAARIERLTKSVRDVFAAIFFVSIGMLLDPADIAANALAVLGLLALVLAVKIPVTMLSLRLAGRSKGDAYAIGLALAQIGEFSFIIAALGVELGTMRPSLYPVTIAVAVVTAFTTSYLVRFSQK